MDIAALIDEHERHLVDDSAPPTPLTDDPTAADSVAYAAWCATAPRRLNLMDADLRGCDARNHSLRLAGLRGCDLRGADLRGADLRGADLRDCKLEGANLSGAAVDASTRIQHIDLGTGLANRTSLALLLEAIGGDPEEEQMRALIEAVRQRTGDPQL